MNIISEILSNELKKRQKNNSAYSLRAFAQFLGVSPASLSQVMSGKRGMSSKRLNGILDKLGLSPKQKLSILSSKKTPERQTVLLGEDQFKLISDWYHFAILSLGEIKESKADARWIARRLNITNRQANDALSRLKRLGIIKINEGKFRQVGEPIKTTRDIPSESIRNYQKGVLGLAQNKLETVPVEKREMSSITMAINTKRLRKAKELTQKYKEEMLELLDQGKRDEVYQLSVQLFPLSRLERE